MKNIIVLLLTCVVMSGCSTVHENYTNRSTLNNPDWPTPLQNRNFSETRVVSDNGQQYVCKSYEDDLEFRTYLEDILRYTKDLKALACYYRADLKEPECQPSPDDTKPSVVQKKKRP